MHNKRAFPLLSASLLVIGLLQLCSAQDIPCSDVQQRSGTTIYQAHLHETLAHAHLNESDCQFMWSNSSDYTLANKDEKKVEEPVISGNISTLVLRGCQPQVTLTLECAKKKLVKYTANCTSICSELPPAPLKSEENRHHWYLVPPFSIASVAVIFAVIWSKTKEQEGEHKYPVCRALKRWDQLWKSCKYLTATREGSGKTPVCSV